MHTKNAKAAGASREEVTEASLIAAALRAGGAANSGRDELVGDFGPRLEAARDQPAAFDATERYAVTVVGAPSYASGAHM